MAGSKVVNCLVLRTVLQNQGSTMVVTYVHNRLKTAMGRLLSLLFLGIALALVGLAIHQFVFGLIDGREIIGTIIKAINTSIVALAIFELGIGIGKEYGKHLEEGLNTYQIIRRTIARFVGTVCIALVLESLIMIIKYSQLDLAGNLFYPVGILIGASVLLMSMGVFLFLTRGDCLPSSPLLHVEPVNQSNRPFRADALKRQEERTVHHL